MRPKQTTVIFDCERMRYPNTGLYVFGKELVTALQKESFQRGKKLMIYARKSTVDDWGINIERKKVFKSLHKRILLTPKDTGLWHSPFQLSHFFPKGKKILLTIHDLNFLYELNANAQKAELFKLQKIVDKSVHIVAISQFVKNDILSHLDTKGKEVSVIYNGCSIFNGRLQEPPIKPQKKFLFSVGTVLPKKNFHVLPCLLQENDYELIIAGVRSEYENKIIEEAQELGVSERVKIIGTIPEAEKHWYYKNCEAFLFPSVAEGFGLPVIEAMYYQRPIFLSLHTCLPEIGSHYAYYFNRDFDRKKMQEEFKEGMRDFSSGNMNQDAMKEHALGFSWANAAKQYWDIYEQLLS
ncbi:glycosyltransferase family 4 protein [Oscillospiraceae bacterium N12]|jgi:glycosyltransferase involved in cell wall biosynthesis|uniref:Glycosyltransferase family 4 protein n=1 Tax=Jilunia laotingensis TaxID=2763675 RepID=A0A926IJ85_9BACT|nr:glycosyltransferase family 1 protein [Jilunia laotingensis]MBC8592572.1 glycosyltransferase family 4 protein [Jilunia laotingensis]